MHDFKEYRVLEHLYSTERSNIYRCKKDGGQNTVIIKTLRTPFPSAAEIGRFKQEYHIIKDLDIKGVIDVIDLIELDGGMALVLEDFGASSLKSHILENQEIGLNLFLNIASDIAEALGHLHEHGVIHKDIKPHNILLNVKTGEIRITDFGISAELTHENEKIYNRDVVTGTLAYMSPEQTGRMNRTVDHRTDFYSLGITLYELLTGRIPFTSEEPMEMMHFHIARNPEPPCEINSEIPSILSDIIMKLISKNVEDRYQNGFGLMADIKKCLTQLNETGRIDNFRLGEKDYTNKFILPDKLFGREKYIDELIASFEMLCHQTRLNPESHKGVRFMMVTGSSGIGKSSLIKEINKPIVAQRGYFIEGKYDQLRRDIPYSAIIFAFKNLIRQILTESDEKVNTWKKHLQSVLSVNGRLITDIIPDVELITGKQPPLPELGPDESRNRFNHVFETFITSFSSPEHPVVLFLDDLQWADLASLSLIEHIITGSNASHLFLLGAYRRNDVGETHPLTETVRAIETSGILIRTISLEPLNLDHITEFTMESIHCSKEEALPLAEIVLSKTGGNPFFIRQFFQTLYEEKQLSFDPAWGWRWDIDSLKRMQVTENIVQLLAEKIKKLDPATREVLKICSIFGHEFDLETVSVLMGKSIDNILDHLKEALDEGLVVISKNMYRFRHDRIYEAVYSLIPDEEKPILHYQIGRITLDHIGKEQFNKKLFYIVDHLNSGMALITEEPRILELMRFNVEAGKKAKMSAAYEPAYRYLNTAALLMEKIDAPWVNHYAISLSLFTEAVEVAYLSGEFSQMELWADVVMENATSILDKVKIYETRILVSNAQHKYLESIDIALTILDLLGVRLPKNPNQVKILGGLARTKWLLIGKKPGDLINLPEMTDPYHLCAMRILGSILSAAYLASPDLYPLVVFQLVQLSVKYGNAPESVFSYVVYGLILCGVLIDIDTGYRFGNLGLNLMKKRGETKYRAKTILLFNVFVRPWKEHLNGTLETLRKGYQIGRDTGDLEYACFNLYVHDMHSLNMGLNLEEIEKEAAAFNTVIRQLKQEPILNLNAITLQAIRNLLNDNDDPCLFNGEAYREDDMLEAQFSANDHTGLGTFFTTKLFLVYLFEDYEKAHEILPLSEKYIDGTLSTIWQVIFYFYDSLVRLAVFHDVSTAERKKHLKKITKNQKKLKKWSGFSEYFCRNKFDLVEAEKARVTGKNDHAVALYESSINRAAEYGYIHEEALAYELLSKFYMKRNKRDIAAIYMQRAYFRYSRWGAAAKLAQLRKTWGNLISKSRDSIGNEEQSTQTGTQSDQLDFSTIVKALQTISGEIVLENLLISLLELSFKNAGADKGFVILPRDNGLFVEASGEINKREINVLKPIPIEQCRDLSSAIVHYVARKKETVILNDAVNEGDFTDDDYVRSSKPKSVICVPGIRQGRLIVIFYLENNLTANAFLKDRVEVLNIISSQIAISIDNARLYEHLEEKVRERTEELNQMYIKVKKANDHIIESIHYSALIQRSILPEQDRISAFLPHSFFIWKPRDIVGGDIYFCEQFDEGIIIALIDCTGHGIPGAFMTMLSSSGLHRIVREDRIFDPSRILSRLNCIIKTSLHQDTNKAQSDDGLDASVCFIDYSAGTLTFSGANMNLYVVENNDVTVIKGDKHSLGYVSSDLSWVFNTHSTSYQNKVFYLTTDGYIDQLGGPHRRRFGSRKLKELILAHHTKPFEEQKKILIDAYNDHKKDVSQTDDISLTGFICPMSIKTGN